MTKTQTRFIGTALPLVLLLPVGQGRCQSATNAEEARKAATDAIQRLGGQIADYADPETGLNANRDTCPPSPERLVAVTFVNTELTDADLESLSYALFVINPKKLDLRLTKVTGAFCRRMNLPKLADLDLSSTLVDDAGLQQIENPQSEVWCPTNGQRAAGPFRLRLNYINVSLRGLQQFVKRFETVGPDNLILTVSGISVTDEEGHRVGAAGLLDALSGLSRRLTGLSISNTSLGGKDLGKLALFPNLVRLSLANNKLCPVDFEKFPYVNGCAPSGELWRFEALDLAGNTIDDKTMEKLAAKLDLTRLRVLILSNTQITNKGLYRLLAFPSILCRLELANTFTIFDPGLWPGIPCPDNLVDWVIANGEVMIRFPDLAKLDISGTGVSDKELVNISFLPQLSDLDLSNSVVTNKGVEGLSCGIRFSALSLTLANTKATPWAANARLDALLSRRPYFGAPPVPPQGKPSPGRSQQLQPF